MFVVGIIATLVSAISFAMFIVIAPVIYSKGILALQLALLRVIVMSIFFASLKLVSRHGLRIPHSHRQKLPLIGFGIGIAGMGIFYLQAIAFIPVSLAVMLFYTWPIVTALTAPLLGRKLPGPRQSLALLAAFICLLPAIGPQLGDINIIGVILALCASLSVSLSIHCSYLAYPASDGITLGFCGGIVSIVLTLPIAWLSGVEFGFTNFNNQITLLAALLCGLYIMGVGGQIVCAKYLRPEFVAIFYNIEPIVALLGAYLILGERLSLIQYISCASVIFCLFMYRGFANERAAATERMRNS